MDGMKTRGWLAALVFVAAAVLTTVACSGGGAGEDKAGGSGKPVVLRLADTSSQLNVQPAVADFVQRVEELSGGDVRIKVVDQWADFASDAEQQVVRDVATHDVDLGWVGTRVFDTLGRQELRGPNRTHAHQQLRARERRDRARDARSR